MRCETHCPPGSGVGLRGPLLAVAGLFAVALAVWAVSVALWWLLAGVALVAAVVASLVVVARRSARLAVMSWPVPPAVSRMMLENKKPAAITAAQRRALPAARPVAVGVVVRDGERIGR
ncbi:MAG TPA: hypothetical protein VGS19_29135 [Streptosporangiaceae bacterium]|nr:hypothetical protein [Streptosporangiaceae bacterium]